MKMRSAYVSLGVVVAVGLGLSAWLLFGVPSWMNPVSEDEGVVHGKEANVHEAPSVTDKSPSMPVEAAADPSQPPEPIPEKPDTRPPPPTAAVLDDEGPTDSDSQDPLPMSSAPDAPEQSPYPSPVQLHLEEAGQRIRNLATVLELDEEATRALETIISAHVRGERALWDDAKIYGDTEVDEQKLKELDQRTFEAIRRNPALGEGMARVAERFFVAIVRDPATPFDDGNGRWITPMELREIARGAEP